MTRVHTYYDNLKVARNAPPEVIKAAYRALSQKYHPDKHDGAPDAERVMKLINQAFTALSDPVQRQLHDEWITQQESLGSQTNANERAAQAPSAATSGVNPSAAPQEPHRSNREGRNAGFGSSSPQPRASKASKASGMWALGVVLVVAAAATFLASERSHDDPAPAMPPNHQLTSAASETVAPTQRRVLKDLLGVDGTGEPIQQQGTRASAWISKQFRQGAAEYLVAFVQVQSFDVNGLLIDCHACAPEIGAVTYVHEGERWRLVDKTRVIGQLGSWGKAPETKELRMLNLGAGPAVLFEYSASGQGYTETHVQVVAYMDGTWTSLGDIQTGADNLGSCEDKSPGAGLAGLPCWSHTGKITVKGTEKFPELLVSKTGAEQGKYGAHPTPALSVAYAFDGKQYVERETLRRALAAAALKGRARESGNRLLQEAAEFGLDIPASRAQFDAGSGSRLVCGTNASALRVMRAASDTVVTECELQPPCQQIFGMDCDLIRIGFSTSGASAYVQILLKGSSEASRAFVAAFEKRYGNSRRKISERMDGSIAVTNELIHEDVLISAVSVTANGTPSAIVLVYAVQ